MILICARLTIADGKKQKSERVREEYLKYDEALNQIRIAVNEGYEPTFFSNSEFNHSITFLKYGRGDEAIMILSVRGTREEIVKLEEDPALKKY